MRSFVISPATLALVLVPLASGSQANEVGPPGTVALRGGKTKIGMDAKDIQKLVDELPGAPQAVRALDAETPAHSVDVAPFYMGLTEVTNEQYAVFVRATGHRPPEGWGDAAITAAGNAFLQARGKENQERKARGEQPLPTKFERSEWWSENWQGAEWSIPKGEELHPVVYVDYSDVLAYCRWAGVRLPTEFEFQHAVRGKTEQPYPWGEDWEDGKYCATSEDRRNNTTRPAGTFEEGRSADGLYELAGNAWEWTSSPYVAYPRFKKNTYKIDGTKEKMPEPTWDGNKRVVMGGCYQTSRLVARGSVRRPTDRDQMTNALGFRIAGSTSPGADIADAVFADVRASSKRPGGTDYELNGPVSMDRWEWTDGIEKAPEGYAVISKYEYLTFVPVTELPLSNDNQFARESLTEDPEHLGFLSSSFALTEPALAPGTYLVTYRAAGASLIADAPVEEGEQGDAQESGGVARPVRKADDPWAQVLDIEQAHVIFYDTATGDIAAHVPVEGFRFGKGDPGGKLTRIAKKIQVPDPADPEKTVTIEEPWLRLECRVKDNLRGHGLPLVLDLKPEEGVLDKDWRM